MAKNRDLCERPYCREQFRARSWTMRLCDCTPTNISCRRNAITRTVRVGTCWFSRVSSFPAETERKIVKIASIGR
jgi:hypothetical protein